MAGQTVGQKKISDSKRQKEPADPQREAESAETDPNKKTEEQTSGSNKQERTSSQANIIGFLLYVDIVIIVVSYFLG